jgi:uncharacterized protein (TIGR00255 family)
VNSMTGFGFAEKTTAEWSATVEIKSYNNRYLEIEMNLPSSLSKLEERIRRFLSERLLRGRIEVFIRFRDFSEAIEVVVNREAVKAHVKALQDLIDAAGIEDQIHLSHLLRLDGILKSSTVTDIEKYWNITEPLLTEAFTRFSLSRHTEGVNTGTIIGGLLDEFERRLSAIKVLEPVYKEKITTHVKTRFQEVLGNEAAESRVMEEIAALFLKSDFHEEVVRLESHLKSFREIYRAEGAIGKKLDFFCQELGREINTIGSKSYVTEVNTIVIDCKEIIERLRELLRNVE